MVPEVYSDSFFQTNSGLIDTFIAEMPVSEAAGPHG